MVRTQGGFEDLGQEELVFRPLPQMVIEANINPQEYDKALKWSQMDPEGYWEEAARELSWFKKWSRVLDDSNPPFYRWFPGARCNIAYNALDRHIETANKNKLALIWEGEPGNQRKLTYYELYREVNRFANALRSLGVQRGDRVVIYMPRLPETIVAMLAAAKVGAVHSMVYAGYSGRALRERIEAAGARLVVTADGYYRHGQVINLKKRVDEALVGASRDCVDTVVVVHRVNVDVSMNEPHDLWYEDLVRQESPHFSCEVMESTDPLFLIHTASVSGRLRGIIHSHGGYMVGVQRTLQWVFDIKPTDIYWCTTDAAWITGHSYLVYGPLMAGTTTVMYEGDPLYPQADRMWDIVSRFGVTILSTLPTEIRMLMRFGTQYPRRHDLSTLRLLGSMGEPFNQQAWLWMYKHIGRSECPIMDTWWQTETGAFMLSPLPISVLKPGSVGKPLPGIETEVVDETGAPVRQGETGHLVIKRPWPSMFLGLDGDEAGFQEAYWGQFGAGTYATGDLARIDENGYYWILGRTDNMLKIAGHRLGASEMEEALRSHKAVDQVLVVGIPDKVKGQVAKAFVVLNQAYRDPDAPEELLGQLKEHVLKELGQVAELKSIEIREELPGEEG